MLSSFDHVCLHVLCMLTCQIIIIMYVYMSNSEFRNISGMYRDDPAYRISTARSAARTGFDNERLTHLILHR